MPDLHGVPGNKIVMRYIIRSK